MIAIILIILLLIIVIIMITVIIIILLVLIIKYWPIIGISSYDSRIIGNANISSQQ